MIICLECGGCMYRDSVDILSKGDKDLYYCCPDCFTSCIREVRGYIPVKEYWHSENDGVKDYEIIPDKNAKE